MSHGSVMVLSGKKWRMASFLVADGPFFAVGLFLTHFPQTCDHNILTCDHLKFTYLPCMGMSCG